jgi:chromosome segregation ATPase
MFAEFSGKLTNDLLDGFERRRHEERIDMEIRIEKKIEHIVEKRVDEKLVTFKQEWEEEKSNYLQGNQKALNSLHDSIERLQAYQEEYIQLKQKYEQLQHTHSQMRDKENERWQKLSSLNKENNHLKNDGEVLRGQIIELRDRVHELESDNRVMKDNEIQDQCKINQLVADKEDLLAELERTEREKMDLKMRVDTLSREIEKLLNNQQERASQEDKAYQDALRKQNDRLDELYKVVQALSDRDRQTRNLFIGGSTMSKTIRATSRPPK